MENLNIWQSIIAKFQNTDNLFVKIWQLPTAKLQVESIDTKQSEPV